MRPLALTLGALLLGCGGAPRESSAETVVLVVVDGLDCEDLASYGAGWDATPTLTELAREGEALADFRPAPLARGAFFASVLTGASPARHGLRSAHELGAERLPEAAVTVAETLRPRGWTALASVASAHWRLQGLDQGFEQWQAGAAGKPTRSAAEVVDAALPLLERSLLSSHDVLLVLQFEDLRGQGWEQAEPDARTLEHFMAEWRGGGGVIDEAFADVESEETLATRLRKALLRRKDDPRRAALEQALRAGRLAELDAQLARVLDALRARGRSQRAALWIAGTPAAPAGGDAAGEVARVPLVRLGNATVALPHFGARAGLAPWLETPWAGGTSAAPPPQGLRLALGEGAPVEVATLELHAGDLTRLDDSGAATGESGPRLEARPGAPLAARAPARGASFALRLDGAQLFRLPAADLHLGATTLAGCDLPELVAQRSPDWPENALVGPVLDLQKAGGRRMRGAVEAAPGAAVEVLLEGLPADLEFADGVTAGEASVERHALRPGAVWIRGAAPLAFEFPTRGPGARLAVLCRVDGARVDRSRMRYLTRVLGAPERLELLLSAGAWLEPALRGAAPEGAAAALQLADELPLPESIALPSPAELGALRRLDADE